MASTIGAALAGFQVSCFPGLSSNKMLMAHPFRLCIYSHVPVTSLKLTMKLRRTWNFWLSCHTIFKYRDYRCESLSFVYAVPGINDTQGFMHARQAFYQLGPDLTGLIAALAWPFP